MASGFCVIALPGAICNWTFAHLILADANAGAAHQNALPRSAYLSPSKYYGFELAEIGGGWTF
jgi:hypothetical protein